MIDRDLSDAIDALGAIAVLVDPEGRYGDLDAVDAAVRAMGHNPASVRVRDGQADELLLGYCCKLARETLAKIHERARSLAPVEVWDVSGGGEPRLVDHVERD